MVFPYVYLSFCPLYSNFSKTEVSRVQQYSESDRSTERSWYQCTFVQWLYRITPKRQDEMFNRSCYYLRTISTRDIFLRIQNLFRLRWSWKILYWRYITFSYFFLPNRLWSYSQINNICYFTWNILNECILHCSRSPSKCFTLF